jgi:hypothetical protein
MDNEGERRMSWSRRRTWLPAIDVRHSVWLFGPPLSGLETTRAVAQVWSFIVAPLIGAGVAS